METMLMLQPIAAELLSALFVIFLLLGFGWVLLMVSIVTSFTEGEETKLRDFLKLINKIVIICIIAMVVILPIAKSWDIYNNVLAYRAINSETTDKTIDNVNILMDKIQEHLIDWKPEKGE